MPPSAGRWVARLLVKMQLEPCAVEMAFVLFAATANPFLGTEGLLLENGT